MTTLVTLGSWRGSLLVMMCVLLTTLDVAGFMHWWGLTIDITSMNIIIIRFDVIIIIITIDFTSVNIIINTNPKESL